MNDRPSYESYVTKWPQSTRATVVIYWKDLALFGTPGWVIAGRDRVFITCKIYQILFYRYFY